LRTSHFPTRGLPLPVPTIPRTIFRPGYPDQRASFSSMADFGHSSTHRPHPVHRLPSIDAVRSTEIAPSGQTCAHSPHPRHLSTIMKARRRPDSSFLPVGVLWGGRNRRPAAEWPVSPTLAPPLPPAFSLPVPGAPAQSSGSLSQGGINCFRRLTTPDAGPVAFPTRRLPGPQPPRAALTNPPCLPLPLPALIMAPLLPLFRRSDNLAHSSIFFPRASPVSICSLALSSARARLREWFLNPTRSCSVFLRRAPYLSTRNVPPRPAHEIPRNPF
jgi:hypothetical protein